MWTSEISMLYQHGIDQQAKLVVLFNTLTAEDRCLLIIGKDITSIFHKHLSGTQNLGSRESIDITKIPLLQSYIWGQTPTLYDPVKHCTEINYILYESSAYPLKTNKYLAEKWFAKNKSKTFFLIQLYKIQCIFTGLGKNTLWQSQSIVIQTLKSNISFLHTSSM